MAAAKAALFAFLSSVGIERPETERTKTHDPAFTVEQWHQHVGKLYNMTDRSHPIAHLCKNLFLIDKKFKKLWLVVAHHTADINLNALARKLALGSGNLRFAQSELYEALKVEKGAVTPLALYNDRDAKSVKVILDAQIVPVIDGGNSADNEAAIVRSCDYLLFHPLTNDASTALTPTEFMTFLRACGHAWTVVDFHAI